jgi:hypothetical protein
MVRSGTTGMPIQVGVIVERATPGGPSDRPPALLRVQRITVLDGSFLPRTKGL